jgi:hypothetical protein
MVFSGSLLPARIPYAPRAGIAMNSVSLSYSVLIQTPVNVQALFHLLDAGFTVLPRFTERCSSIF